MPAIKHCVYALVLGAGVSFSVVSQVTATEKADEITRSKVSSEDIVSFLKEKRPILFKLNYNASVDYVDGILAPDITQFFELDPERKSDRRLHLSGALHMIAPLSERSLLQITGIVDWFGYDRFHEYNSVTVGGQGALFYKINPRYLFEVQWFCSG